MIDITLNNGVKMPILGYGVFQVRPDECERCVLDAISLGYRHIDTAQAYNNEEGVGAAIKKCAIARDELFITSKVWISNAGETKAAKSIDESLRKLQSDYIDLMLVHQPFGDVYGSWRAMERALKDGKLRAIGVSNFAPDRFIDFAEFNDIKPAVNQIETHPYYQQKLARKVLDEYGCAHESWGPLAEGKCGIFDDPILTAIANNHNKTVAQVCLRWMIQNSVIVIPKSVRKERMKENFEIFDFALTSDEMAQIAKLDRDKSAFWSHTEPDAVKMFCAMGK
jgi:diketogulonate reductase-like aldo/keto reductase